MTTYVFRAIVIAALVIPGAVMSKGEPPQASRFPEPAVLTVEGPGGARLIFSGPTQGLYRKVEALLPGRSAVEITLSAGSPPVQTLVDGLDADGENGMPDVKLKKDLPWSLGLWSLDGNYGVLKSYELFNVRLQDRDSGGKEAYDTRTGEMGEFASKSTHLGRFSFDHWSPTKPGVPLLLGMKSSLNEGYLVPLDTK